MHIETFHAAVVHIGPALDDDSPGLALVLAEARFEQGVDDRQPGAREPIARQFLARHVGEDAGQLGIAQLADLGAEEDFGCPFGRGQPLRTMDQAGQLGGQSPLGAAPAGVRLMLGQQGVDLLLPEVGEESQAACPRRHRRD